MLVRPEPNSRPPAWQPIAQPTEQQISIMCIFSWRKLARIAHYFEITAPLDRCDGFRSHFRMTPSTFKLLAQLLSSSEHIPKGNSFGRRPTEARKQIAVAVWALANQETCRQLSDCFDITMSSVLRCIGRVLRALVDVRTDLTQWPRGNIVILAFTLRKNHRRSKMHACRDYDVA